MKLFENARFAILGLFILTLIAYGQTSQFYFLIDDNALIYNLQHLEQPVGYWGTGIFGQGPYRHIVDQFLPFFPLFDVNPMPYFVVGIILYFLASVVVYFFAQTLTKNKSIALVSASIFAAGYVGSEAMFGIVNSWQTTRGIIMTIFTFLLFYKFIKTRRIIFYLLSVAFFFFSVDTVYIRAHGLVFAIFFFDILFWPVFPKVKSIVKLLVRQLPFFAIHYYIYLSSPALVKGLGIFKLLSEVFQGGKSLVITIPIQDIGNLFIPDKISSVLDHIVSPSISLPTEFSLGSFLSGLFLIFLLIYLTLKNFRKEDLLTKVLVFSFSWSVVNFIVFWMRETTHTLWTTHRYFLYSVVGVSLFWSTCFYLLARQIKKERLFKILTIAVIVIYLFLGVNYQREFNEKRSFPAKKFFASFEHAVPNIPKGAVTYFDLQNDSGVRGQFGSFFGGMFSEASNLVIYTKPEIDYMTDFLFTYKFDDIIKGLDDKTTTLDKVFTFYYEENGLVNTTSSVRQLLTSKKIVNIDSLKFSSTTSFRPDGNVFSTETDIYSNSGRWAGKNPLVTIIPPDTTESVVPSKITFSMSVKPIFPPLPYEAEGNLTDISADEKSRIFAYISSQNNFRETAIASSGSFWKEEEPRFAIDGRLETSWRGHRGYWDDIDRGITDNIEYFQVDLKRVLDIGQVMWVSSQKPLVPIHYRILTSINGTMWDEALEVRKNDTLPEGTVVFDFFSPTKARFVKMEVLKTYGNDGPELKEFEVVETAYTGLDRELIEKVTKQPFANIDTVTDSEQALAYIRQNAKVRFYWMSDSDTKQDQTRYLEIPIHLDSKFHEYTIQLPATGISWTQFSLEGFNFPAQIAIKDARLTPRSIDE